MTKIVKGSWAFKADAGDKLKGWGLKHSRGS